MFWNWVFWKKFIFTSGVVGLSLTPIGLINKYGDLNSNLEISAIKKNLKFLAGKYADKWSIKELSKEIFNMDEMKSSIDDVFAQDLAYLVVKNSPIYREKYREIAAEEAKAFETAFDNYISSPTHKTIQKFYDSKGGNREDMKRRDLTEKAFEVFKKELLDFDKNNFNLNSSLDAPIDRFSYISPSIIETKDKWKNIGFYPYKDDRYLRDPGFFKSKFDFINFAHKVWFSEVRPFYVWMSLWKYKQDVKDSEIENFFDKAKLKEKKVELKGGTYGFPYYSKESMDKFKKFYNNKVKNHSSSNEIFIPRGYTDDSATSILVEGKNMYSNLYIKFAAAANYRYQKLLSKNLNGSGSSDNKYINKRSKSDSIDTYKQPTELFLFSSSEGGNQKAKIPLFSDMFKEANLKSKNEVADLVEVADTPWTFIRNQAGIHVIAVDSENCKNISKKEDIYHHFQYRTLQNVYKDKFHFSRTVDVTPESVIDSFKKYLEENLSRLILKYYHEGNNKPQNYFFDSRVPTEIDSYKSIFGFNEKLLQLKERYQSKFKLRESLIDTYAHNKWEIKVDNKFEHADVELGLAGMIPWALNTEANGALFSELEKIYDHDFGLVGIKVTEESAKSQTSSKTLIEEYRETKTSLETQVSSYIDQRNLNLDENASSVASDRIFSNNYYINQIIDRFLDKTDLFNEFLFKYLLKDNFLSNSVLGKKKYVDDKLGIVVPTNLAPTNGNANETLDKLSEDEKLKKVLGKLDALVKQYYYSRILLEKESSNPWDAVKYSGDLVKNLEGSDAAGKKKDLAKKLQTLSAKAFEEKITLGLDGFRSNHYRFLTTLIHLLDNDFKHLIEYLSSQISYEHDSYIVFKNTEIDENTVKISEDSFHNPFLNRQRGENDQFKKEVKNIKQYLSSVNEEDSSTTKKVEAGFVYLGFYTGHEKSSISLSSDDVKRISSEWLYRYGSSAEEMKAYVQTISTETEFNKVVAQIKVATKSDSNDWVSNLEYETIYIEKTDNGSTTKEIKTLTLQERKNLLLAYLNKVNVSITNQMIKKTEYKKIFLTDPDNSFNLTNTTHTTGTDEKLKQNEHFKQKEEVKNEKDSNKKDYKLFQLNKKNVEDFEKLKTFVNGKLSKEIFWAWVIDIATKTDVQDLAIKHLSSESGNKIEVYDSKWMEKGKDTFVKK